MSKEEKELWKHLNELWKERCMAGCSLPCTDSECRERLRDCEGCEGADFADRLKDII